MAVKCDTCNKDFEIEIKTKYKFGLEIQYFICPHCQAKYTYVVIDNYIRERQKEVQELRDKINKCTKQKQVNKLTKEQDKILRNMKKHSDNLIKDMKLDTE
ncbi:transglycosylase [Clostridium botulinum]|uniref:transglycosylase n=1 Tax=Clostridium botulinum TaxID=1491 RepID=UPI00069CAB93|nr:transglycosylase [Clostridium botulinum]KOA76606.1 transglycosylase [Clostridium botulinum]